MDEESTSKCWTDFSRRRTTRRRFLGGALAAGAGLAGASLLGCKGSKNAEVGMSPSATPTGKPPNFVVIMSDEHRASFMGVAGDRLAKTPNLDRLAGESVRFTRTYCQGPLCQPSRASFLTERYVRDHGIYINDNAVPHDLPTYAQSLQQAGYYTSCVGKMHIYPNGNVDMRKMIPDMNEYGFDEPIEAAGKLACRNNPNLYNDYLEQRGLLDTYFKFFEDNFTGKTHPHPWEFWNSVASPLPVDAYEDVWTGRTTADWIDAYDRDQPFLQFVGFPGPHYPWDPPQQYLDHFLNMDIPIHPTDLAELPPTGILRGLLGWLGVTESGGPSADIVREMRRYYYAEMECIDEQVGNIIAALERKGILDNTWIIYTSDHGEMAGDHGLMTKLVFYEPAVTVPLMIRPPGGTSAKVVTDLIQQVDVPATMRAIAGAPDVPLSEGKSLLGYFQEGGSGPGHEVVYSEMEQLGMVSTATQKLVFYEDGIDGTEPGRVEPAQLFDLTQDPDENHNLVNDPSYAQVRDELMTKYARPFLSKPARRTGTKSGR